MKKLKNRVAVVGISDTKASRRRDDATFFQLAYEAARQAGPPATCPFSGFEPCGMVCATSTERSAGA